MGEEDKKCLFCFPLECGVLTLAILTFLSTIWLAVVAFWGDENGLALYGVSFACCAVMSIAFIYGYASPSEDSRKIVFITYIVTIVLGARIWYTYNILNGKVYEAVCHEETLEQINAAGITETITAEDCAWGGKRVIWADHLISWAIDIYFATAIQRWSQNEDGYEKQ